MKKWIATIIIIVLFLALGASAKEESLDFSVKELHATPSEDSNLIYKIPLEVVLLDFSEDANWYKVRISFALGPFRYTYVGWTNIPVGDTLISRERKAAEVADLP